ncbi:MAG TPA: 30S ribosomal protein S5, partial [Alphaproteobacteria bacterium]|nr:30S ribosomal protein S5 [Alphaproteobacteria bacterium]
PYNMVRATIEGLTRQVSPRMVAARRGKKIGEIQQRRLSGVSDAAAFEEAAGAQE